MTRKVLAAAMVVSALLVAASMARAQSSELIVDILITPQNYWNRTVTLKGHVRSVAANPPGTDRGSYVLRDSSDRDITVLTSDLPSVGQQYTIIGTVRQTASDQTVPVLQETRRTAGIAAYPAPPRAESRRSAPATATSGGAAAPAPSAASDPASAAGPAGSQPPAPSGSAPTPVPAPARGFAISSTHLAYALVGIVALLGAVLVVALVAARRPAAAAQPADAAIVPAPQPVAPQAVPVAALTVIEGPDRGRRFVVDKAHVRIGRPGTRENEVTLTDAAVSRAHASVVFSNAENAFQFVNESTVNPAQVNGQPAGTVTLRDGDLIRLGETTLQFRRAGAGS